MVRIKGSLNVSDPDDATLSFLELTDPAGRAITLSPTFASATTSYTATVERDVTQITVVPVKGNAAANVEYQDESNSTLVDAESGTDGQQVDLDVGTNTVKVKVTAGDGITTETYTVVVTRLEYSTLVKNTHLTRTSALQAGNEENGKIGQRFTTGSHVHGYTVTSVGIHLNAVNYSGGETLQARIHEFNDSATNNLGTLVATLATPSSLTDGAVNFFDAPDGVSLDPNTQYILNFHSTGDSLADLAYGDVGSDAQTGAVGWEIENSLRSSGAPSGSNSLMIEVRGGKNPSLGALGLTDSEGSAVTLNPTFASVTTSYTATVDSDILRITVTPTTSDDGAEIEYLDGADQTLVDADGGTDGHQADLALGTNTIKVKVTAGAGNSTRTYTLVVTRLEDSTLVKNTHLGSTANIGIGNSIDGSYGQRFTTGSHAGGYTVTSVGVFVNEVGLSGAETVTVYIHEFDDSATRDRGTLVATLTTPTLVAGAVNYFDAHPGTTLDAGTEYIVNFHSTGDSISDFVVRTTSSDDQMGTTGWLIENAGRSNSVLDALGNSMMIEVRGNINVFLSDLALTDSANNSITLSPTFAAGTTSYTASVDDDIDQITVAPTKNDDSASVEYLDESDATLTDANGGTEGHQISLDPGNNTFKVRVTAEDGVTARTYTVKVSRTVWEATLTVRDLGSGDLGCANGNSGNLNCTSRNTLTNDDFTYDSTEYDVTAVKVVSGGKLRINLSADLTAIAQNLILHVGSETFRFEDADTEHPQIRYWLNSGLTWTAGSDVELKLTAPPASDDATLSALELADSNGDAIAPEPTFASGTTSYTASVENDIDQITVTPTENNINAAVEYLDENDDAISDADSATDGQQVALEEGENTIKVKVTSTDLTTTRTYTVIVTRLTDLTLVRNTHISEGTLVFQIGLISNGRVGQRFTTGANLGGYEVTSVGIYVEEVNYSGSETLSVRIHEFDDSATNDLGDLVATLTTPTLTAGGVNVFTAPSDTTLSANTKYIVNFHSTGDAAADLKTRTVSSDDQTGASGWLIEDSHRNNGALSGVGESIQIEVRGNPGVPSDDATLSALALTDQAGSAVTLSPTFASVTTSYTASVDEIVEVLTVTPTPEDAAAAIEYLDGSDGTLADSDDMKEGQQVSLVPGENTFKVQVTAEDGVTTETYTVIVTRLSDSTLVKNSHLAKTNDLDVGNRQDGAIGQRFTTGDSTYGYSVNTVGVYVAAVNFTGSETVTARIHEFDESATNDRGTLVATLTTPTLTAGGVNVFTAPSDTTLPANTQYIVNFHSTGDAAADLSLGVTAAYDQMGAMGWLIEDSHRDAGSLSASGASIMIEVRGNVSPASTDATLSDLALTDPAGGVITLSPTFASATTSYSATVDSDILRVTVTPTTSDDGAEIEYLDGADQTLVDADGTDGHQADLALGTNTIKVKVTAEDGVITETYTVVVTRLEDSTLVKNTHLSSGISSYQMGIIRGGSAGQRFTTGSHAGGYTVTSVGVFVNEVRFSGAETMTVYIHEFDETATNGRGTLVATLTTPGTLSEVAVNYFDAHPGTTLDAGTEYIVNFHSTGNSTRDFVGRITSSDDQMGTTGWLIEDAYRIVGNLHGGGRSLMIEVRGNTNAFLSDLALTDPEDSPITLDPSFAASTASYTATVENDVARITVTPSANYENADFKYLDGNNATLPDADDNTASQQVDLDVGENTFKVRVTAGDSVTPRTYTVVVTRRYPPPVVGLENINAAVDEPAGGGDDFTVNVGISVQHAYDQDISFKYLFEHVTTEPEDISGPLPSGTLTIPAGDTRGDIPLLLVNDDEVEGTERIRVTLSHTSPRYEGDLAPAQGQLTISDNDTATFGLQPIGSVFEGSEVTAVVQGDATVQDAFQIVIHALASMDSNAASAPADFPAVEEFLQFAAGSLQESWTFTLPDDDVQEGAEVFLIQLRDAGIPEGVTLSPYSIVVTILDSDDATLSDLALTDSDATDIDLDQAFASATTGYTVTVDRDIAQVTVTPTTSDSGANVEYLDDSDTGISDADGEADGQQVDLDFGENTVKVKVTAEDGIDYRDLHDRGDAP